MMQPVAMRDNRMHVWQSAAVSCSLGSVQAWAARHRHAAHAQHLRPPTCSIIAGPWASEDAVKSGLELVSGALSQGPQRLHFRPHRQARCSQQIVCSIGEAVIGGLQMPWR